MLKCRLMFLFSMFFVLLHTNSYGCIYCEAWAIEQTNELYSEEGENSYSWYTAKIDKLNAIIDKIDIYKISDNNIRKQVERGLRNDISGYFDAPSDISLHSEDLWSNVIRLFSRDYFRESDLICWKRVIKGQVKLIEEQRMTQERLKLRRIEIIKNFTCLDRKGR